MDLTDTAILIVPALVALLAAGMLADKIELWAFSMRRASAVDPATRAAAQDTERQVAQRRAELATLKDKHQKLTDDIDKIKKETVKLKEEERAMADASTHIVAEFGYPQPRGTGYYAAIDGPAIAMPYTSLASAPTILGGRRRLRLVIWGLGPTEAERAAKELAGNEAALARFRPFHGSLKIFEL